MDMKNNDFLTFAIPKGGLFGPTIDLLTRCGFDCREMQADSRKMIFVDEKSQARFIICRPTDIPTYVEYGAADVGLVGKDTIAEQQKDIYELLDLKYGGCHFAVAVPNGPLVDEWKNLNRVRVASKFPHVAEEYFHSMGKQVNVIKLHGNIELAPMVGLAEMIVDIVSSGKTLRENNLIEVAPIMESSVRLIANRVSQRIKNQRINQLSDQLRLLVDQTDQTS